jgi:hypothetical protein
MKSLTRRVWVAVASAALAGGAVLGAGGVASAAVAQPVAHTTAVTSAAWGGVRDGYSADGYAHGFNSYDGRWGGGDRYVRYDGRWIDVSLLRAYGADGWYTDQLLWINH